MNLINKNSKNCRGFTLTEVLVTIVIVAIFFLTVGVISKIAITKPKEYAKQTDINADAAYGFKLMRKHVRESKKIFDPDEATNLPGSPWIGKWVKYIPQSGTQGAFGLYDNSANGSTDFIYLNDTSLDVNDEDNRETILSIPSSMIVTFNPQCSTLPASCSPPPTPLPSKCVPCKSVEVTIQVIKGTQIICDLSTRIVRRL